MDSAKHFLPCPIIVSTTRIGFTNTTKQIVFSLWIQSILHSFHYNVFIHSAVSVSRVWLINFHSYMMEQAKWNDDWLIDWLILVYLGPYHTGKKNHDHQQHEVGSSRQAGRGQICRKLCAGCWLLVSAAGLMTQNKNTPFFIIDQI